MKHDLRRIEATLDQINTRNLTAPESAANFAGAQVSQTAPQSGVEAPVHGLQAFPLPQTAGTVSHPVPSSPSLDSSSTAKPIDRPSTDPVPPVQPFSAQITKSPNLPKPKPTSISSHRHAPNPNLAISLLQEIEATIVQWQLELEQVVLQIQALYAEGPIVDAWLESRSGNEPHAAPPIGTATLRHAEIEHLMAYIDDICQSQPTQPIDLQSRTGYRLCGLDADGKIWSRPCPPPQVPYISLAIARYQKLRTLLVKKQEVENRLNQLVESLTKLHGEMVRG